MQSKIIVSFVFACSTWDSLLSYVHDDSSPALFFSVTLLVSASPVPVAEPLEVGARLAVRIPPDQAIPHLANTRVINPGQRRT